MSELIKQGESLGYIKIDSETNYITYLHQNKRRKIKNNMKIEPFRIL